jgi:chemotaxis signal transduction protein
MKNVNFSKNEPVARSLCLFQSGSKAFAVGLESVAEVIEIDRSVRLPHSPPNVLGMCVLRRDVVPVLDIAEYPSENTPPRALAGSTLLLLKTSQGIWGVQVSSEGIIVTDERPEAHPDQSEGGSLGIVQRGETSYAVIDPEATWRRMRLSVERWYSEYWGPEASTVRQPTCAASNR